MNTPCTIYDYIMYNLWIDHRIDQDIFAEQKSNMFLSIVLMINFITALTIDLTWITSGFHVFYQTKQEYAVGIVKVTRHSKSVYMYIACNFL